jgi:hypothetical protein
MASGLKSFECAGVRGIRQEFLPGATNRLKRPAAQGRYDLAGYGGWH